MNASLEPLPPLVSLVMTVATEPELALDAIESVRAQAYEHWELYVVLDGIDGGLPAAIARGDDGAGRVHVLQLAHARGRAAARNAGLALARGRYVAYLDEDDHLDPPHVSTLVGALAEGDQSVAYVMCRRLVERRRDGGWEVADVHEPYAPTPFSREGLLVDNFIPLCCLMHRRACLDEVGRFDPTLAVLEEWDLWIRLSRRYDFVQLTDVTCSVRFRRRASTAYRRERYPTVRRLHRRHRDAVAGNVALLGPRAQRIANLEHHHRHTRPEVSVVVASHNQAEALRTGLSRLAAVTRGLSYEVVVVDNASTDDTARYVMSLDGDVRALVLTRSLGLGAALNRGAAQAAADQLVFWRPEALPKEGWLLALREALRRDGAVATGAVLLGPDGRLRSAGYDRHDGAGVVSPRRRGERAWSQPGSEPSEVDALGAGALLVSVDAFRAAEGFDEAFTGELGFVDLSLRLAGRRFVSPRSALYVASEHPWPEADRQRLRRRHAAAPPTVTDVATLARQARDVMMAGQLKEAAERVRQLEAQAPQHPETWLVRAVLAMQLGEHDAALESFSGALVRGANAFRAKLGMGMALTASQRLEEAWALLREMAERYPAEPQLVHALFRVGVALRRWAELVPPLGRYLQDNVHDDAMRFALASVCLRAGDRPLARVHYQTLRRRAPTYRGLDDLAAELSTHA